MYYDIIEKIIRESSVDYPRPDLDMQVWAKSDEGYVVRENVQRQILNLIDQYPERDLLQEAREIRLVGSIGSNLYVDDSDLDVHIVPEDFSTWNEDKVKEVMDWFKLNDKLDKLVGQHPIEVYVQLNPSQDLMSVAVYDLLNDDWLEGPKLVPLNYDPYNEFNYLLKDIRQSVQNADLLFGELKRDVIDYEVVKDALFHLPKDQRTRLYKKLKNKLGEIEKDIEQLYLTRKEWVDARHNASRPNSPEEAKNDIELAMKWNDTNALFKFINRYGYMKAIQDLEELIKYDNKISPQDVDVIKGVIGDV
jgi:hypothetical protein